MSLALIKFSANLTDHQDYYMIKNQYATKGTGKLLLADDQEKELNAGDVVRFADKDIHGLLNDRN